MMRPRIELDFVRTRPRVSKLAAVLLGVGVMGFTFATYDYWRNGNAVDGLQMRLDALAPADHSDRIDKAAAHKDDDAAEAANELATPWSVLLQELELASQDSSNSVAVLAVEPDRSKRQIRVSAEARTLDLAIAYVQRLQESKALRFPMLENHEIQDKDPQRPVRFEIRADWRLP